MKKLFFATLAALVVAGAGIQSASAQKIATVTRFAGEKITGVDVSGSFDVILVRSAQTGAVVKIDRDLEQYLRLELTPDGVVSVGLKETPNRLWRVNDDRVMQLTLSLPELNTVRMRGSADLTSRDTFTSGDVNIMVSGSGDVEGLNVSGTKNVMLQTSGSADVFLLANEAENLTVMVSGSGDVVVESREAGYAKLSVAGSADVALRGGSERGEWRISGSADVETANFAVGELTVDVAGSADVEVCATGRLDVQLAGSGSVRYTGSPRVNSNVRGSGSVKPLR